MKDTGTPRFICSIPADDGPPTPSVPTQDSSDETTNDTLALQSTLLWITCGWISLAKAVIPDRSRVFRSVRKGAALGCALLCFLASPPPTAANMVYKFADSLKNTTGATVYDLQVAVFGTGGALSNPTPTNLAGVLKAGYVNGNSVFTFNYAGGVANNATATWTFNITTPNGVAPPPLTSTGQWSDKNGNPITTGGPNGNGIYPTAGPTVVPEPSTITLALIAIVAASSTLIGDPASLNQSLGKTGEDTVGLPDCGERGSRTANRSICGPRGGGCHPLGLEGRISGQEPKA